MAQIEVERVEQDEPPSFRVRVTDDDGSSAAYMVTLSTADQERLAAGYPSDEAFVLACLEFLLKREPKESILRSFDISEISTYFPEFEAMISRSAE